MKQKLENVMKNKKVMIALMEIAIAIGCIVICYLLMSSNNRAKETTYSYSKLEEVTEYKVVDNYITRVMPLTTYDTFKEIAENTLNAASENVQYTVKVYSDAEKTEEVTDGYVASGMVVEALEKVEPLNVEETEEQETVNETSETESVQTVQEQNQELAEETEGMIYTVSVIGDMTSDGDVNVTELTKLIKNIIGLKDWELTDAEKLAADISEDGDINVVDIELCINYIVFGELKLKQPEEPEKPIEPSVEYTVVFKDEDGTIISTNTYKSGDRVEVPENPEKAADETGIYNFIGWTPEVEEIVTKDAEYTATYEKQYFIARVEETGISYLTLNDAVQSVVGETRTIKMLKDTKESVTIGEGQNITLNLNGKIIEGTEAYVINNQGILTIIDETEEKQGTIKASGNSSYGLYNDKGNIILKSGNIVSRKYGVYNPNDGIVEIGVKDQAIIIDTPTIEGKTNAVYDNLSSSGKINYYDGTLKGNIAIFGGISDTEDNSKIVSTNEEENEIITLEASNISVIKIGENEYKSLAEAISAVADIAEETTIIQVIADFSIVKPVEILQNKNITIDLAGHTVTTYGKGGIINNGILQITDSTEKGTGKIISKIGIGLNNKGILTIERGTIEVNGCAINNEAEGILTLGVEDGEANETPLNIKGTTYGIKNTAVFNLYGGIATGEKAVEGVISDREYGHCIVDTSSYGNNVCYLEKMENGERYEETVDGITWSYVFRDEVATEVEYKRGKLSEVVTIPAELDGFTVISVNSRGGSPTSIFEDADPDQFASIKQVIIPEGITTITTGIYNNLPGLTNIEIPEWVTSIKKISFEGCNNVTKIYISKNVEDIEGGAIDSLSSLSDIEVSEENNNYCDIEGVLYSKDETTIVKYPEGRGNYTIPDGVTRIGDNAFSVCSNLTKIDIPEGVTSIGENAFRQCTSLTNIDIPNSLTSIGSYTFQGCSKLTDIYINNLQINISFSNELNYDSNAYVHFSDCKHTITKEVEEGLEIQEVSNNLEDGQIPCGGVYQFKVLKEDNENVIVKVISEGEFINSENIEEIINPNEEGIYTIENINRNKIIKVIQTENGKNLQATDKNGITWNYTYQDGNAINVYYESGNLPEEVVIPSLLDGYPVISVYNSSNAWRNIFVKTNDEENYSVKKVTIPEGVIEIGHAAFYRCWGMSDIEIPNTVKIIGGSAFQQTDLRKVIIPEGVTTIYQGAFHNCLNLTSVEFPSTVTVLYSDLFYASWSLEEIKVSEENTVYCDVEGVLYNKEKTVLIRYPIGKKKKNYAILDGVTNIANRAFEDCGSLTQITIPSTVRVIEGYAFYQCNSLTEVVLPEGVESIGYGAFEICRALKSVTIPSTVTNISWGVFRGCDVLEDIYIGNLEANITFEDSWNDSTAYIHYDDCKHDIVNEMLEEGVYLEEVSNNVEEGKILCRQKYQFKLVDENGETIKNKVVTVRTQGKTLDSADVEVKILPNEEGIYTIENVNRNITIVSVEDLANDINLIATDNNGITWSYIYQDGKATNVHYYSGKLGEEVEIPNVLDGYEVQSLYNEYGKNIFAKNKWEINRTVKRVKIPNSVTNIGEYAFYNCESLITIEIPNSVTSIGECAFYYCENIISVTIPDSVEDIGEGAFRSCHSLENVKLQSTRVNIEYRAFDYCGKLTDIYVENMKPDELISNNLKAGNSAYIHYSDCKHLISTKVYIKENRNIQGVDNNLEEGKILCGDTYKFKIIDENGETVTDEKVIIKSQGEFINSSVVEEEIIPDDEGIYTIENVNRDKIIKIISNCQTTDENGITWNYTYEKGNAVNVYYESGELTEIVNIPSHLDGYPVISLYNPSEERNIFANAENGYDELEKEVDSRRLMANPEHESSLQIKTINIPETVIEIGNNAFEICTSVENIDIPNSVTSIGDYAFFGCTELENIEIPDSVRNIGKGAFGICNKLKNVILQEGISTIEENTFYSCVSLEFISIPKSVTAIEKNVFSECFDLTDIYINNEKSNITIGSYWSCYPYIHYSDCKHDVVIKMRSNKNLQIEEIDNGLVEGKIDCGETYQFKLVAKDGRVIRNEEVEIESQGQFTDSENTIETIKPNEERIYIIENVNRNKTITIGEETYQTTDENGITWNYTYEDGKAINVYYVSGELTETVNIPSTLDELPVASIYNSSTMANIFNNADYAKITNVILPEELENIGTGAFSNCDGLKEIRIPDKVNFIGQSAFANCTNLSNIKLSNNLQYLEYGTFQNCTSLKEIKIPSKVTNIDYGVFYNCVNLSDIYVDKDSSNIYFDKSGIVGHIHYKNCKHDMRINMYSKNDIQIVELKNNFADGKISCGETYQFKLVNEEGEIVKNEIVTVKSQGQFLHSAIVKEEITPDEEGIYTIQNINRNKVITIGQESYQATVEGITWNYSYEKGNAVNVYYASGDLSETVNIPSHLDGYPVRSLYNSSEERSIFANAEQGYDELENKIKENRLLSNPEYESNLKIKTINIPNTVTEIGDNAFEICTSVETINIVNSLRIIGDYSFFGCTSLKNIEIPNSITSIGNYAFGICSRMTNIYMPNTVTNIGNDVFYCCPSLTDIYVDNLKSNISLGYYEGTEAYIHYSDCKHDITINMYSKIAQIEEVSNNLIDGKISCGETYKFKLIDENGEVVTDEQIKLISHANEWESVQEEISLNEDGVYEIKNINRNITITIGQEKYQATDENGITWNYTYQYGKAINVHYESGELAETVDIPSHLDGYEVISLYNSSEERSIFANAEDNYDNLEREVESNRLLKNPQYESSLPIKTINIPDTVITIGNNAFEICTSVENINIPNSVTSIGEYAFFGCTSLTEIEIPNSVTNIENYSFYICTRLESIKLPESITKIGNRTFYSCVNLKEITIPETVTSIGEYAFYDTAWDNNQADGIVYAGKVAYKYKGQIPSDGIIELEEGTKGIASGAFRYYGSLIEIIIPDSVERIEKDAFYYCTGLTTVTMSKNIKYIGEGAFGYCESLSNIVIWNSVDEVGRRTFGGWRYMQTINIEDEQTPAGWDENWNEDCEAKIVYAYSGD